MAVSGLKEKSLRFLILALALSLLMTLLALSPDLWDRYRVTIDVQNSYWMARFQDPTLFPTDYLLGEYLIEVEVFGVPVVLYPRSLGWGLLFYVASFMFDFIWLSKFLVFILMPVSVIYLFKIGQLLEDNLTALTLSFFYAFFILATPQSMSIASGLQRSFAVPILVLFLYFLVSEKYVGAGLMIFVSTLIYLPCFPLTTLAYVFSLINFRPFSIDITRSKILSLIGGILLSGLVLGFTLGVEYGWMTTLAVAPQNGGAAMASPLYISFPWFGRAGVFDTGSDVINFLVLVTFGFFIYKIVGPSSIRKIPRAVWCLIIAGFVAYFIALFFILQPWISANIYYPSRYTRSVLFLAVLCYVGLNWQDFLAKAPAWFRRNVSKLVLFGMLLALVLTAIYFLIPAQLPILYLFIFLGLILSGLVVLLGWGGLHWLHQSSRPIRIMLMWGLVLVMILLGGTYIKAIGLKTGNPSTAARNLYEFVWTLPKDALLAGDPVIMTDVPLFSRRSVFFTELNPGPSNDAIVDFFDAQYAETPETVLNFCLRYDVDYLVLNEDVFSLDFLAGENFYAPPHNERIVEKISGRSNFVLPKMEAVFTSGPYKVIRCDAETLLDGKTSE